MDPERVREYLLQLPYVEETMQWGANLVFWVGDKAIGGKMFALIHLDGAGTGVLWFHGGAERYQELLEIEGIIPAPYMAKAHWVTIERWDVMRQREFEDELRNGHALVYERLPKRVQTILAMPEKERSKLIRERRKALAAKEKKA